MPLQPQKAHHQKAHQKSVKKAVKQNKKQRRGFGWKAILGLGFICAALVAVLVAPSPYEPAMGGITLIGAKPEVSVYGPELPANIVAGYSQPVNTSSVVLSSDAEDNTLYVYAAEGAKCYHLGTCKFAFASAQRLTIMEAHFLGYTADCGICEPPTYAEYYG